MSLVLFYSLLIWQFFETLTLTTAVFSFCQNWNIEFSLFFFSGNQWIINPQPKRFGKNHGWQSFSNHLLHKVVLFGGGLSRPWIHFGQSFKAVLLLLLYICSITLSKKWPATLYMGQLTSSALSSMATLSLSLCCIVAPNVAFHLGTLGRSLSLTVLSCVLCLLNMFHTCTYLFYFCLLQCESGGEEERCLWHQAFLGTF